MHHTDLVLTQNWIRYKFAILLLLCIALTSVSPKNGPYDYQMRYYSTVIIQCTELSVTQNGP